MIGFEAAGSSVVVHVVDIPQPFIVSSEEISTETDDR